MIALELSALIAMGIVVVLTFAGSARTHARHRAWLVPVVAAHDARGVAHGDDTVASDAHNRFGTSRHGRDGASGAASAA